MKGGILVKEHNISHHTRRGFRNSLSVPGSTCFCVCYRWSRAFSYRSDAWRVPARDHGKPQPSPPNSHSSTPVGHPAIAECGIAQGIAQAPANRGELFFPAQSRWSQFAVTQISLANCRVCRSFTVLEGSQLRSSRTE